MATLFAAALSPSFCCDPSVPIFIRILCSHDGTSEQLVLESGSSSCFIQLMLRNGKKVNQGAEESFKKTVDVDRLIDTLRDANTNEKDYEELASSVMSIVDCLVHKTNEINEREQQRQLGEGFLAEVNAQLRQAKEDEDKLGLQAMLQKVLQLYASRVLSKRSYAKNGISLH